MPLFEMPQIKGRKEHKARIICSIRVTPMSSSTLSLKHGEVQVFVTGADGPWLGKNCDGG
jgi:hypothetical protein